MNTVKQEVLDDVKKELESAGLIETEPLPVRSESDCSVDYAYETIEEYENFIDYEVNPSFRLGWEMARTTNAVLGIKTNSLVEAERSDRIKQIVGN